MNALDRNVYQLFTMGFCDAEPVNTPECGGENRFKKITKIIPYLKALGVNTILFAPLFESVSHGYDTTDYKLADKRLGSNDDLKALCTALHAAGFEILFDCVFNHVGREHFAFKDLQQNRENSAYRSWFQWVDFGGNNGYQDGFSYADWAGCANLVKLNLCEPAVKSYLKDVLKFWIDEFDIDGVRLDAANVMDHGFLAELSDYAREQKPGFFLFGEIVGGDYAGLAREGHLDSVTNYECFKGLYSSLNDRNYFEIAHSIRRLFGQGGLIEHLPASNFADNHDVDRVASTIRDKNLLVPLYTLLYTMPGFPTVYYGSEQGIEGKKAFGTDAPLRPPYEAICFSEDTPLFKTIAKLGNVRANCRALRYGAYRELFIKSEQFGFMRETQDEHAAVLLNCAEQDINIDTPLSGRFYDLLSGETIEGGGVSIPAFSARILIPIDEAEAFMKDEKDTTCKTNPDQSTMTIEHPGEPSVLVIDEGPTQPEERAEEEDEDGETQACTEVQAENHEVLSAPRMKSYMDAAIEEAKAAALEGEVPVGAVIVHENDIIARAHNLKESTQDPTAHAELLAVQKAAKVLGRWRLSDCELYVTAEPCPMCMGAIMQARISRVVYGTNEPRYGAVESTARLGLHAMNNAEFYPGVEEDACRGLLSGFFEKNRENS